MEAVVGRREDAYATLVSAGVLTGGSGNLSAIVAPAAISLRPGRPQAAEVLAELRDEDGSPQWWQDITLPMLESMRRRVRGLVRLIERTRRNVVYTDFEDQLGGVTAVDLRGVSLGMDKGRFEAKVRTYLRSHEDHLAVQKLRRNRQITATDLSELERVFLESAFGTEAEIERAKNEYGGPGLFVRSLTGLDREAATAASTVSRAVGR